MTWDRRCMVCMGMQATGLPAAAHMKVCCARHQTHSAVVMVMNTQVCQLDAYFTDLMWYPVSSKKNQAGGTDVFAVACTDGERSTLGRDLRMHATHVDHCCESPRGLHAAVNITACARPTMPCRLVQDCQPNRACGEERRCAPWRMHFAALEL